MNPSIIADTNVVSFYVKRDTRIALFEPYLRDATVGISFMTVAELYKWEELRGWGPRLRADVAATLNTYVVLPPDRETCRFWARVIADCTRIGRPITGDDAWIAAAALQRGVPLVTYNRRDFAAVPGLRLLPEAT